MIEKWTPTDTLNLYLFHGIKPDNMKDEPEEIDEELDECEQCGEPAWDGYICHVCGMKHI
jgi:hypothetical protein